MKKAQFIRTCVETLPAAFPQHFRSISAILALLVCLNAVMGQTNNNTMPLIQNVGQLKNTAGQTVPEVKFYTGGTSRRTVV